MKARQQVRSGGSIPVFVNPTAGSGGGVDALAAALAEAGLSAGVRQVEPGRLGHEIRAAIRAGAHTVGIAGGDGTISTAAALLAGTGVVLAPFPAGTLNHFARRLGLDTLEAAVAALVSGHTTQVPVGAVRPAGSGEERRFVNNASCGFYPHVVRHRERLQPWLGKWPATVVAGTRVLLGLRRLSLALDVPAEATLRRRVPGLWVGLGRSSFALPADDHPKSGARNLELVLPHAQSGPALVSLGVRVLWRLARHLRPDAADLEILHAPAFTLEAGRTIDIALDGEPVRLVPPLRFELLPDALEVVAATDA